MYNSYLTKIIAIDKICKFQYVLQIQTIKSYLTTHPNIFPTTLSLHVVHNKNLYRLNENSVVND